MSLQRPSICFVALNGYTLLSGRKDLSHVGGAELQQVLVARALAERGFRVSFVTADHGQSDGIEHQSVRVFKAYSASAGLPLLRFLHPRWTGLCSAMRRADADIYYQRTGGIETGQVALWCKRNGRRFVFAAAVDPDCDPMLPHLGDARSRWFFRAGLRRADLVVCQSDVQATMLRQHHGIQAALVRSCARAPATREAGARPCGPPRVLWVGRFAEQKRLDRLLELAEACPECTFDLIGKHDAPFAYARQIRMRAAGIANVNLVGWVPNENIGEYYLKSWALVCTSDFEGFPNTFLEAWSHGVPVLTSVDPDGIVAEHGVGIVGQDVPTLRAGLLRLIESADTWQQYSDRARHYFRESHTIAAAALAYERLLLELGSSHPDRSLRNSR